MQLTFSRITPTALKATSTATDLSFVTHRNGGGDSWSLTANGFVIGTQYTSANHAMTKAQEMETMEDQP